MASVEPPSSPPAPRPKWKDPFVIGFALGAIVLTALPFLQRRFLKAPPPIRPLPAWALTSLADGGSVTSAGLSGKVLLIELAGAPCDAPCVERQQYFGTGTTHTDDLRDAVQLVTVVQPGAEAMLSSLSPNARWHLVGGDSSALLGALRDGWLQWAKTDAGQTDDEFFRLPAVILVDQRGELRGFWQDDPTGRGNAINAARLLAEHGPRP